PARAWVARRRRQPWRVRPGRSPRRPRAPGQGAQTRRGTSRRPPRSRNQGTVTTPVSVNCRWCERGIGAMRPNRIKQIWAEGGFVTLGWLSLANPFSAEVMARQGFDALCIDMQHGLIDYNDVWPMLQAIS